MRTRARGRRALLRALCWAFLLAACGASARADGSRPLELPIAGLPTSREAWVRLDTENFRILSSAETERTLRLARQIEGLHDAISRVTRFEPVSPVPTWIYIFSDDVALTPYKHLYRGEPASMSGALYSRPWGDYIAMNGKSAEARVTVFHEYLHVVLRNNLPGIPLWLEEGLAEFFSTFTLEGQKQRRSPQGDLDGVIGRPVPWHARALRQGERTPLGEILRASPRSEIYNRFEHQGEFYARSWELVHYLLIGNPERRVDALRYLTLSFEGLAQDEAFRRAFGGGYDVLERELEDYRRDGYASRRLRLPATSARLASTAVTPLPYPRVLSHLGELLHSQGGREGDAGFHFEQAVERDPTLGGAIAGLGLIARENGDLPRARALFQRAAAAGDDARSHYLYGSSLLAFGRAVGREKIREALGHVERSLALDAEFAPAWAALGQARRLASPQGERPQAAAAMPSDPQIALKLLMLHSRARNQGAAREVWEGFFDPRPASPEKRAAARILGRLEWLSADGPAPDLLGEGFLAPPAAPPPRKVAPPPRQRGERAPRGPAGRGPGGL